MTEKRDDLAVVMVRNAVNGKHEGIRAEVVAMLEREVIDGIRSEPV